MSNPAPTLNQINAFNATQGTTIDFNIIGGTEVIRSNKIYIYDLSDNSLICTHLYVSTESIHELPPNTSSSIVYASGKSSADFTNNTQYYAQIQTFTDTSGTQGASGLSVAKLFWCLPTPTLTLSTIPTTISTTSYNVSATYTPNTSGSATNEIQEFQFNLYSAIGALLQTSGVVLYGEGVDLSYNFSGLEVGSTYYVTLDATTTQGMNVSAQSNTFTVSIDTPTMGSASVVNNGCDGYISVTSNLSSEYEHEKSAEAGEIISFTTDSVDDITELDVDFSPVQDGTPWMSVQNTEPYTFRAVPTQTEDFGYESDTLVGGTVAWNQLVPTLDTFQAERGVTMTYADGVATISSTTARNGIYAPLRYQKGNKYLFMCDLKATSAYSVIIGATSAAFVNKVVAGDNQWHTIVGIGNSSASFKANAYIFASTTYENLQAKNYNVIDLTAMFGSAIADYIYSLEQATAGAGVAWFRSLFPKPYYAYNAGELISVNTSAHNTVGFNAWDEEWELGAISGTTGQPYSNSSAIRSKNYCKCLPNTTYYAGTNGNYVAVYQYDANQTFIGYVGANGNTFTTYANAYYFKLAFSSAYGTTYNNDICINLSDASLNGTYEPYTKHSYPLDDSITLRGVPKLDASNNLYYDGDVYKSDGSVTRKYGIIDLASITWEQRSWGGFIARAGWSTTIAKRPSNNTTAVNAISTNYTVLPTRIIDSDTPYSIGIQNDGNLFVMVTTDSTASDISGKFIFELATPTTEIADPYTNPQIVDPSGTEEYVGSPIPVGHNTTYQRICPISGWDSVEVDVSGVNLFPWVYEVSLDANYELTDTGVRVYKLNNQGAYRRVAFKVPIGKLKGQTLTFSADATIISGQARVLCALRNSGGASKGTLFERAVDTYNQTFTVPNTAEDTDYISFSFYCTGSTASYGDITYSNVQLELGTTKTAYQPYQDTNYTSTFPKYKQQVTQDKIPYITKNIGDTYADTLTENLVGGTIAWNQSVPDTTTTHTISGSIASMDDAVAGNFESVVCDITPLQDLHGYDKPWVGGAGANLFEPFSGTSRGITFTPQDDGTVKISGTVTTSGWPQATKNYPLAELGWSVGDDFYAFVGDDPINFAIRFLDENGTQISQIGPNSSGTVPQDTVTVRFIQGGAKGTVPSEGDVINTVGHYSVSRGTTAPTEWTPWENLCPITGWTGCEVDVAGVNLVSSIIPSVNINGSGELVAEPSYSMAVARVKKGQTYTCTTNETTFIGGFFTSAPTQGSITYNNQRDITVKTFTAPIDGYVVFRIAPTYATAQLDIGSIASDYSAYNGTTYNITWQTEAGTVYGGTVDLVTGLLTVDRAIVDLGTLAWQTYGSGSHARYGSTGIVSAVVPPSADNVRANILCTAFEIDTATNIYNHVADDAIGIGANGNIYCYATQYATAQDFKTAVTGQTIVYKLATPTTYQLDPVQVACLLGQNNVWNNISNTTVTYPTNHSYQSLSTTHKYYKRINGVESISVGSDVVADVGTDNIIDLTQMFGTTIADYIYNREQSSSSGMGVKFFKSLFPNNDYDYNSGALISVNASAHVIKDANGNVLHTYPLDSDLALRGIPKLDANNKLYYDGDVYEPNGSVTRKYGIVDLGTLNWTLSGVRFYVQLNVGSSPIALPTRFANTQVGNIICKDYITVDRNTIESKDRVISLHGDSGARYFTIVDSRYSTVADLKTSLSGVYLVYELATPTTEQADPFEENQAIVSNGIEEYIVTEQGDVEMPIGHDSTYYTTKVYGRTIDMAKGVLTIDRKVVDLGSLTWVRAVLSGSIYIFYSNEISDRKVGSKNLLSSEFQTVDGNRQALANVDGGISDYNGSNKRVAIRYDACDSASDFTTAVKGVQLVYELETPIEISFTPQQIQTLSGQNNIWSNTNGGMYLVYQIPITSLLVKRRDVADVSGKWLTLYSTPITQADDMDFTFIDFLNQYGKTYQYALVPVLAQDQSGVIVQIEGGYTVSDNVDSIFDGVYIADQTNVERVKAGVGYGNIDMNQGVGSITPIGSKYPIVITNSQNQYHNGSVRGTIVPNDFYSNGNLSRIDMVNKRDELEQFLTNKRAKIIKDWNGKMWLVMIMSNVACSFDDNYGMGMVSFSANWLEVGDPTSQQDLYNAGLINVGGV